MPVGTQGAIKGLLPQQVAHAGAQIILANTYHLMLRPGSQLVAEMGGLHQWIGWGGPILTDSGGFQVFSLADINRIDDQAVTFKSHLDGNMIELSPKRAMQVQNELGADIIMALDDCPPAEKNATTQDYSTRVQQACERTNRWLDQCIQTHNRQFDQALFGIIQGGTDLDQRRWCVEHVCSHDLAGYAIGGVAVGEGYNELKLVTEHTAALLPDDKPRYLMGVGYERDLVTAVRAGVDMFDCVLPTRNGRTGNAFTRTGQIRLKNARYTNDPQPIDPDCDCPACSGTVITSPSTTQSPQSLSFKSQAMSRSYLRHLFMAGEMLGPILVSLHNLHHFQRLMLDIRWAIQHNDWFSISRQWPVTVE